MRQIVIICFFLLQLSPGVAQYNLQSCHAFWQLTKKLRNGEPVTDAAWDSLRQTEGYRRKGISDEQWKIFQKNVTLVFTPGNETQVANEMNHNINLRWIDRFAREESTLKKYAAEMAHTHLMDSALFYARRNLPEKYKNCAPAPTIYFLLYDYDANGNANGVNMDLLVSYDMDTCFPGRFSGHEVFHYILAYCRIKYRRFREVSPPHHAAFMAVNGIGEEGTADLIDKQDLLFNERSPYMLRDTFYTIYAQQSADCIIQINHSLEKLADQQGAPYTTRAYWNRLMPVSGHIPGLFMAQTIRRQGLEKKLVKRVSNPFAFFYLYNTAAQKDPEKPPVFSAKAIEFIKLLERRYLAR